MMRYYKATRMDGKSFHAPFLDYVTAFESNGPVFHPVSRDFGDMKPNRPSTYISTSIELGEVLIGGRWPCRLFRVEPIGDTVTRTDGCYPHKRGCVGLYVCEEIPAHMALGPNGEVVSLLIERIRAMTLDEFRRLGAARDAAWGAALDAALGAARDAAWDAARGAARDAARGAARDAALDAAWDAARDAAWGAARDAAWGAAWGAARDAARGAARDAARDAAWGAALDAALGAARDAAWGAARDAAWGAAWGAARDAARGAARDAAWGAARDAAWGAARDAALGLLVRDLIPPEHFNVLYGPWREVME